jgi:hypothetical protein
MTMPDRYEDGIRALQGIEAPDQWDGIRQRANGGLIVPLDWDRRDQRRRWHTLLAAAAALLVVVGVAALFLRDGDDVTTDPANPGPHAADRRARRPVDDRATADHPAAVHDRCAHRRVRRLPARTRGHHDHRTARVVDDHGGGRGGVASQPARRCGSAIRRPLHRPDHR